MITAETTDNSAADLVLLTGDLTIYNAAQVAKDLLARVTDGGMIAVDLDGVTEIDSAGVQLLLVTRREVLARGGTFRFLRPSRPVRDVIETFALSDRLAPPAALPAASPDDADASLASDDNGSPPDPTDEELDNE
jgi:anti-anti-sigma factor